MRKYLVLLLVVAVAVLGIYAEKANAADGLTPYANINIWAAYTQRDKQTITTGQKKDTDFNLYETSPGSSAIGVVGTKNNVKVQGEYGVGSAAAFRPRLLMAEYTSGDFGLMFGRASSPYANANPNDIADGGVFGTSGTSFESWQEYVKVSAMGAYVAFMKPQTSVNHPGQTLANTYPATEKTDALFPKMAVGYMYKMDTMSLAVNGAFQQLVYDDAVNVVTPGNMDKKKINSYLLNATLKANVNILSLNVHGFYGQNTGNMGVFSANGAKDGNPGPGNMVRQKSTNDGYDNTKSYGGNLGLQVKFSPMVTFNAGLGYELDKNDQFDKDDSNISYFVNAKIALVENCFLIPELKQFRFGKSAGTKTVASTTEGNVTFLGIGFQATI